MVELNQNLDKLPQDAKDIIQAIFDDLVLATSGLPPDCIEVKLDNPVHNLLYGDGTVHFHALGNTEHYLHYRGNDEWAIIYAGKNIGNVENGRKLLHAEEKKFYG